MLLDTAYRLLLFFFIRSIARLAVERLPNDSTPQAIKQRTRPHKPRMASRRYSRISTLRVLPPCCDIRFHNMFQRGRLCETNRRSYMMLAGLIGASGWFYLANYAQNPLDATAASIVASLGVAISDVVADSIVVEKVRPGTVLQKASETKPEGRFLTRRYTVTIDRVWRVPSTNHTNMYILWSYLL